MPAWYVLRMGLPRVPVPVFLPHSTFVMRLAATGCAAVGLLLCAAHCGHASGDPSLREGRDSSNLQGDASAGLSQHASKAEPGTDNGGEAEAADSDNPRDPKALRGSILSIIGTNDLHGHLGRLGRLAGYVDNLREQRRVEGHGGVLLLDAGDMFQGTLVSNLREGAPVVAAYNLLRYDAVAIGNHEFDFGPVGPRSAAGPGDDPIGALRARMREANFPFLTANIVQKEGSAAIAPEAKRSILLDKGGINIGVIGASTEATLHATLHANVRTFRMLSLAKSVAEEAASLRKQGAQVVVLAVHAGGACNRYEGGGDSTAACKPREEVFRLAEALPSGSVHAIVAGHTHQMVAHTVHGIPIIESRSYGALFGRIDLRIDETNGAVTTQRVFPPQSICRMERGVCKPEQYGGRAVETHPEVAKSVDQAFESVRAMAETPLGVDLAQSFSRHRNKESAACNFLAATMLEVANATRPASAPRVDIALMNSGGVRKNFSKGPLRYEALFESYPFDNRLVVARMRVSEVRALLENNLKRGGSMLCWGGIRAKVSCPSERRNTGQNESGREKAAKAMTIQLGPAASPWAKWTHKHKALAKAAPRKGADALKTWPASKWVHVATVDYVADDALTGFMKSTLRLRQTDIDKRLTAYPDLIVRDEIAQWIKQARKKHKQNIPLHPRDFHDPKRPNIQLPNGTAACQPSRAQ